MISSRESYDKLLDILSKTLGIELSFEDDSCHLEIPELDLGCCIRKFEDEDRIVLLGVLAKGIPDELRYDLVIDFLSTAINPLYKSGPTVAYDEEDDVLLAYVNVDIRDIEENDFPEIVDEFMVFEKHYRDQLNIGPDTAEDSSKSSASEIIGKINF
ncbi:CesT family type III secretion system chaperone [uncultured Succinivibrio sp.]|uniref:CesT family type III secretion system chaperone n=1 Tax=uncultured Succinivibrio sp. TaxID=540749 RepID=UPI0025E053CC|nr:CesT family type III secretion system chaperone [uncultured Succinivibrio sp.]